MHVAIKFSRATFLSHNIYARIPVPGVENGAVVLLPNRVTDIVSLFRPNRCARLLRQRPTDLSKAPDSRLLQNPGCLVRYRISFPEPLQKVSRARCRPSSAGKLRPSPSSNNSSEGYEGHATPCNRPAPHGQIYYKLEKAFLID